MITVLRPAPHRMLVSAIDRAVAADPTLAHVRSVLLQPLDTLSAFAAAAQGALADDHQAMERLRLMISMAAGPAFELKEQLEDLHQSHSAGDGTPCEPGVVDLGALIVVAFAAGRVGARQNMTRQFVDTVLWTALAAMPAESIVRTLGAGLATLELRAILASLGSVRPADARLVAMMRMLLEPSESARWRCFVQLFARVGKQAERLPWDAALSAPIESVTVGADDVMHVKLAQPGKDNDTASRATFPAKTGPITLVFASAHAPPLEVSANVENYEVRFELKPMHRAGWIGVVTKKSLEAATKARLQLKSEWANPHDTACLRDSTVPVDAIAERSILPPRTDAATWGVRIVDLSVQGDHGALPRAGKPAVIEALLAGAKHPRVEAQLPDRVLPMDVLPPYAHAELPAELVKSSLRIRVRVFASGTDRPDDERETVLQLAPTTSSPTQDPARPEPGEPTACETGDEGEIEDEDETSRAVDVYARGRARAIVLIRPALVRREQFDRVSATKAQELTSSHDLNRKPLPWLSDEELVFEGAIDDPTGPAIDALFERLEALAARTSGLEDASWVALLPGSGGKRKIFTRRNSEAARELVIASTSEVGRLFEAETPGGFVAAPRLRIAGQIDRDGIRLTQPPRVEIRAAGPGSVHVTDFVVVGIDAAGQDVVTRRIHTVDRSRGGQFSLLLPVTDDVVTVEFRYEPELFAVELRSQPRFVNIDLREGGADLSAAARFRTPAGALRGSLPVISRPLGAAALPEFSYDDTLREMRWRYRHERGVRPDYVVELRAPSPEREIWRRLRRLDGDVQSTKLDLDRVGPDLEFEAVRLIASDGFHAVSQEANAAMPGSGGYGTHGSSSTSHPRRVRIRIRRAGKLRYWADLLDIGTVEWSIFEAKQAHAPKLGTGPLIILSEELIGRTLIAKVKVGSSEYEDKLLIGVD